MQGDDTLARDRQAVTVRRRDRRGARERIVAAAVTALVGVSGCGGARTPSTPAAGSTDAKEWFCQMASEDSWDCVQESDPDSRRPERLPAPAEPQPPATVPAPSVEEPASPPTALPATSGNASTFANVATEAREPADPVPTEPLATEKSAAQAEPPMKLAAAPGDYYAVQLVALDSIAAVEAYVNDHELEGMSAARIAKDDRLFYVLLLGVYPDLTTAEAAIERLPASLAGVTPWIRPMRALQAAMRRAGELQPSSS